MRSFIHLMRLDKPIGIWLTFFPAAWVLAMYQADWWLYPLFLCGAGIMRSAGCIINDLTDREFDKQVARTRLRPLAAGTVSVRQAMTLLVLLLGIGLGIVLLLPPMALPLAFATLPLIIAYPWMKRITWWPQAFLGITFNMGTLFAAIATTHTITLAALCIYAASIFWTLGYDTLYALQDTQDDTRIGVKSTALRLGDSVPRFVAACYAFMGALLVAGGVPAAGVITVIAHGGWQVWQATRGTDGGVLFRSNQWLGLLLLCSMFAAFANI